MDLKTLHCEVQQLLELFGGWSALDDIPPVERDLALEKLRRLYEALRFGAEAAAEEPSVPVSVPLGIDLDEVLTLEPAAAKSEPSEASEPLSPSVPEAGSETETESPEPEAVFEELIVEIAERPATASEEESAPQVAPQPAPEVATAPEPPCATEPEEESAPEPEPQPASASEGAAASQPEPPAEPTAEPTPPIVPTLFGIEEHAVRHRHRQRVIMSLYDPEPTPAPTPEPTPAPASIPDPKPAVETAPKPTAEFSAGPAAEPEPIAAVEPVFELAPAPESELQLESVPAAISDADPQDSTHTAPQPAGREPDRTAAPVLGEVINHDVRTLSDTIAPPRDVASELRRSEPVADLRRAVGINDKFLLIRDLFEGDGAAYEVTIRRLNECETFDDAMIYIAEHFAWNPNSDGAKLMMDLLERKFA